MAAATALGGVVAAPLLADEPVGREAVHDPVEVVLLRDPDLGSQLADGDPGVVPDHREGLFGTGAPAAAPAAASVPACPPRAGAATPRPAGAAAAPAGQP